MRFGLRLIGYLGSPRRLVELAVRAEKAGFDSVWFPHDTFMANTWVLTSAVAQATSRIHIGTVGTNPFTTDPSEIATYIATADLLSEGRMILGLGVHTEKMVEWVGLDGSDYVNRTAEAVDLIRRLLRGENVVHHGEAFRWERECYLRFEPWRADLPIYVAAFGSEYLRLSGGIGDGSLPMLTPPESAAYMVGAIEAGMASNPRPRSHFVISGCAWLSLAERSHDAASIMRDMVAYFAPYLEAEALATIDLSPDDFKPVRARVAASDYEGAKSLVRDDMLRLGICGTPADVVARVESLASLGIDEINLGGPLGPDPELAIDLMGREVIPHFR